MNEDYGVKHIYELPLNNDVAEADSFPFDQGNSGNTYRAQFRGIIDLLLRNYLASKDLTNLTDETVDDFISRLSVPDSPDTGTGLVLRTHSNETQSGLRTLSEKLISAQAHLIADMFLENLTSAEFLKFQQLLTNEIKRTSTDAFEGRIANRDLTNLTEEWNSNSGTSMSSPAVAGAIALWLQANPTLSPSDILGVLSRTCTHYDGSLKYPNNLYGYGQIDVYAGLLDILGLSAIREISAHSPQGVTIRPLAQHGLELSFDQKPEKPVRVSVYTLAGMKVFTETFCPTSDIYRLSLPASIGGVLVVQVDWADGTAVGSVMVKV